ncbi:MAG: hypothetical protein ABSH37_05220 [Bryobacteraceae bacterium]
MEQEALRLAAEEWEETSAMRLAAAVLAPLAHGVAAVCWGSPEAPAQPQEPPEFETTA